MSARDPSAPGLPLAGGGGGGASLPVADPADLLSGATPERFVIIDDAGDGALISAAQAAALLGVGAARSIAPDLSAGSIIDTGGVTGVATATAFTATTAIGAAVNDGSELTISWPAVSLGAEVVFRATLTLAGAGDLVAKLTFALGGSTAGQRLTLLVDEAGNVTMDPGGGSSWPGTPLGNSPSAPRTTSWVKIRLDPLGMAVWSSASSQFDGPFYAIAGANLLAANSAAPPTVATMKFYLSQVTTTATDVSTIVVDNVTVRPL